MDMWLKVLLYALAGIGGVWIVFTLLYKGKPLRRLFGGAFQGACALAAVNVTGMFTGISIGISTFSAIACGALGVPGVITMLLLNVIFAL